MTFSSAPGGLGFSGSSGTGVILQTSSRAEARAHHVVGRGLGRASADQGRELSSPERGPVTRHIFLPAPNQGNYVAPEKAGRRRFRPPASTPSSRLCASHPAMWWCRCLSPQSQSFLHTLILPPLGTSGSDPTLVVAPTSSVALPARRGQFPGPAVIVLAQTVPPSRGHCPLELLPASWHSQGTRRLGQHLLGL